MVTTPCLVCPDCVCRKVPKHSLKCKAFGLLLLGIFAYTLSALYLQKLLSFALNTTEGYSNAESLYRGGDILSNLWHISVEEPPPPGPWQFAGRWIGQDALGHNATENPPKAVQVFTGVEVHYPNVNITSAKFSRYKLIETTPRTQVGDTIHFRIEARDGNGNPQVRGGDFWTGILSDPTRKAYTAGRVTDFKNGTYLMTFVLVWSGKTQVEIRLIYPSRVTNWLRTRYRMDNHYPTWQGTFQRGKETRISNCYLSYGRIPNTVCEYKHYRALTHTRFFCRKPAGFACGNLVGHRNVLPYGRVIASIMQADQIDIFKGVGRYKTIEGVGLPLIFDVQVIDDTVPPATHLQLPPCGTDLPISLSAGYWLNETWTSLVCKPTFKFSKSAIRKCLRNYNVHLTGDSTTRQWFFALTDALSIDIPGGNDRKTMKYRYISDPKLNLNLTFTFHPLTYQMSFVVNISQMRFEADVILNLPPHTCNHVVVISPWTHFITWPWEAYVEWLTNIKRAITEARRTCPGIKIVIKSPHALENEHTSRSMMGVDVLFWDMKNEMRTIFDGSNVSFVDIWDLNEAYPVKNEMHMPIQVINQEVALFLSYICP